MAAPMKYLFLSPVSSATRNFRHNVIPMLFQVRNKHKINIKHPRPGSDEREVLAKVTAPIYLKVEPDQSTTCTRRSDLPHHFEQLSEYEQFLINHQRNLHEENKDGILAFYHLGSCTAKAYRKHKIAFERQGMQINRLNRKVFHHAVRDTKYETLNIIMYHSTVLITCAEPKVKEMMELVKKTPPLYLLCSVVEGQLLSKTEVETYATFPDKLSLLAQTCATLDQSAQQTSQLLTSQQEQLVRNLNAYSQSEDT